MKTDLETLRESYENYKDKKGPKAKALLAKIEAWENLYRLFEGALGEDCLKTNTVEGGR